MTYSNENNQSNSHKGSRSKIAFIAIGAIVVAGVAAAGLYLTDVDQTQEAKLPTIDVQVENGQMPKFDVDVAGVGVSMKETEIEVPKVGVETKTIEVEVPVDVDAGMEEETIEVPTINIDRPVEDNPADNPVD